MTQPTGTPPTDPADHLTTLAIIAMTRTLDAVGTPQRAADKAITDSVAGFRRVANEIVHPDAPRVRQWTQDWELTTSWPDTQYVTADYPDGTRYSARCEETPK